MFDLKKVTPRVREQLAKRYNFADAGVMTLQAFIQSKGDSARKKVGNHRADYDRRKFNRMTGEQQRAYEERLNRPDYQFWFDGVFAVSIPKCVFDALTIPDRD